MLIANQGLMVDREKLKAACRGLDGWALMMILDRAIDHVPSERLGDLIKGCGRPIEGADLSRRPLLAEVHDFHAKSLKGHYYETFDVNWKNSSKKSKGTEEWLATCNGLFRRCATEVSESEPDSQILEAFELLFDLLEKVDEGEEIVFWADEGGSYEVAPGWQEVLPCYFACLSHNVEPTEYVARVLNALEYGYNFERDKYLQSAHDSATPAQREALARVQAGKPS